MYFQQYRMETTLNYIVPNRTFPVTYEEIVNSYFMHCYIKSQAPIMSSEIKINLNGKEGSELCKNFV